MGDVFDALARSKGKPAPLDSVKDRPVQLESGAGLSFDEADLAPGRRPLTSPPGPAPSPPLDPLPRRPTDASQSNGHRAEPLAARPAPAASSPAAGDARAARMSRQYRQIRDGMRRRGQSHSVKVHLLASSTAHEARTPTLINIGIAFSEVPDRRTLLLEANLRAPTFHRFFQKAYDTGLVHLLRGDLVTLQDAIHPTRHPNVDVLPAGDCVFGEPGTRPLLAEQAMADLMIELRSRYDHILIDAPPLDEGEQACLLASMADESLLVVRMQQAASDRVERSKRLLRQAGPPLAGVILSHG